MKFLLWTLSFLCLTATAQAQTKPAPADVMIEKYLAAETDRLALKFLDGARTLADWQKIRPRLYQEYMDMLGLWPIPAKTPLQATVTGTLERHGAVIENIHFQSRPGLYVTANLYRPKTLPVDAVRLPAIVYVCGHSARGRDGNKSAFQDHGLWFANNGYVCIVLDTLQLGEIPGIHHGTYGRIPPRWWWHSAGYTPAGVECWNGVRAIDYLVTRPDVDPGRIGVTGISGGGAATFWIAAADDRVKVAVPVSGMSDLESYIKHKVINGHCDCMFLYNTYQWDWTTIAALVAPRPMLFANSDNDGIFPMDGNRRIIEKLHQIYSKYGKPDLAQEYVSPGGHDYRPDLRLAIFKFINKYLKNDTQSSVADARFDPIPGKELRVFPIDDDLPKDILNGRIDESFVPRAKVPLPEKGAFAQWKTDLLHQVRQRSLRSVLRDVDIRDQHFVDEGYLVGDGKTLAVLYMDQEDYNKIKDYKVFAQRFKRQTTGSFLYFPRIFPVVLAKDQSWDIDDSSRWTKKSPPNFVERSHALIGETIDERKLHYLLANIRRLAKQEGNQRWDGRIVGKGQAGIIAAYAALLEPSIKEVILIDPPATHMAGPYFLNILRILDIPDALGMLAPTPLTLIGADDPAFDRTAEIYRRADAAAQFQRK
jgi:dienelactone hydrolase